MANGENVRKVYTGIIDLLPVDWQRFVNDQLPHLERLIDQEVEQFGRELAVYLEGKVDETVSNGQVAVRCSDMAMESAIDNLEKSRVQSDAGLAKVDDLRATLPALGVAGGVDVVSRGLWHANALRGLLGRLREDFAADRVEGLAAFGVSLDQWCQSAVGAELIADEDVQSLVNVVRRDHDELSLPHRPARATFLFALDQEREKANALQRQIDEVFDASSADDQPHFERLGRALSDLSDDVERVVNGEVDDLDDVRATTTTLERAMARVRVSALDDIPGLVAAWIQARVATTNENDLETLPAQGSIGEPEERGPSPETDSVELDSVSAAEADTAVAAVAGLTALRKSLADLRTFVEGEAGLRPRLRAIKDVQVAVVDGLAERVEEHARWEREFDHFEAHQRLVKQKREQLLREAGEQTEKIVGKVMANVLAQMAEQHRVALKEATESIETFRCHHQAASDARRSAAVEIEKARRSLAESLAAYAAAVETVREGARGAKLPMPEGVSD